MFGRSLGYHQPWPNWLRFNPGESLGLTFHRPAFQPSTFHITLSPCRVLKAHACMYAAFCVPVFWLMYAAAMLFMVVGDRFHRCVGQKGAVPQETVAERRLRVHWIYQFDAYVSAHCSPHLPSCTPLTPFVLPPKSACAAAPVFPVLPVRRDHRAGHGQPTAATPGLPTPPHDQPPHRARVLRG